jgi:hypothetical protein
MDRNRREVLASVAEWLETDDHYQAANGSLEATGGAHWV